MCRTTGLLLALAMRMDWARIGQTLGHFFAAALCSGRRRPADRGCSGERGALAGDPWRPGGVFFNRILPTGVGGYAVRAPRGPRT
jgi:hypothetical protein